MSKKDELKILSRQTSADAPIRVRGRTGDVSNVGSMIDLYAHAESPEEIILGRDDRKARERFQKGFEFYLNRIFNEREREFLRELLLNNLTLSEMRAAFGVNSFAFLQEIQKKAFKNAKPLIKIARLSEWEGAVSYIRDILQRLQQLQEGVQLNEVIPQNKRNEQRLEKKRRYDRIYRALHREEIRRNARKWDRAKWDRKHAARLKELEEQFVVAFDALQVALVSWIEAGSVFDGCLYEALNEKNDVFACVCKDLNFERSRRRKLHKRKYD